MSLPVRLTTDAEDDFNEEFDWYEAWTPPSGPAFEAAVRAVYRRLSANPRMHARVYGEARKALVSGYPYVVMYAVEATEVVVFAVHHTSRDPAIWQGRLPPP
jgi:plasmid stabilization system protein ParE